MSRRWSMGARGWIASVMLAVGVSASAAERGTKLLPAPWTDGETLWLAGRRAEPEPTPTPPPRAEGGPVVIRTATMPPLSLSMAFVATADKGGRTSLRVYRVMSSLFASTIGTIGAVSTFQQMDVDAETLVPAEYAQRDGMTGEVKARFSAGRVDVDSHRTGVRNYEVAGPVFEQAQLPFLLRRLPLADGFKTTLPMFAGGVGAYPFELEVTGRETLTVPAGRFDCFKLEGRGGPNRRTYWVSADDHRYFVRQADDMATIDLVKVGRWGEPTPIELKDDKWDVSLTLPAGWVAQPMRADADWVLTGGAMSADGEAQCNFRFENFLLMLPARSAQPPVGWRPEKPRTFAEREMKGRARYLPTYAVRPDSWVEDEEDGRPVARYVADMTTRAGKGALVEYASYRTQPYRVVGACYVPKDAFEARKAELSTVLGSVRLR